MAYASIRSERFVDTKYGISASVRPHYKPNPLATKETTDVNSILDLLERERDENVLYDKIWKQARSEFKRKSKQLERNYFIYDGTPDECYIAIIAYTLDNTVRVNGKNLQLYSDFNERFALLSTNSDWKKFPYRSLHYLLMMAEDGVLHQPSVNARAYRGVTYQFNPKKIKVNDYFYFDNYSSFMTDWELAKSFTGGYGTLLKLPRGASRAIGIDGYSSFNENEILVFPSSRFWVKEFQPSGSLHKLALEKDGSID